MDKKEVNQIHLKLLIDTVSLFTNLIDRLDDLKKEVKMHETKLLELSLRLSLLVDQSNVKERYTRIRQLQPKVQLELPPMLS